MGSLPQARYAQERYPYHNMSDDYISFDEAARNLELDILTFTRLVKKGGLPVRIKRGKRQVSRADLDALIERSQIKPGALVNPSSAARTRHPSAHRGLSHHGNGHAATDPKDLRRRGD